MQNRRTVYLIVSCNSIKTRTNCQPWRDVLNAVMSSNPLQAAEQRVKKYRYGTWGLQQTYHPEWC